MSKVTTAIARQKRWVGIECDSCGAQYACLVEAFGHADDAFLPLSDGDLKEIAVFDLDLTLRKKAESMPCPRCGALPPAHVDRALAVAKRLIWSGLSVGIFAFTLLVLLLVAPKAPAWVLLVALAIALILPRFVSGELAERFDPNRDLERNLRIARIKMAQGILRLQS